MAKVVRTLGSVLALVLLAVSALVVFPNRAAGASLGWTTDTDFTAAGAGGSTPVFLSTEVVGTGAPAAVELVKSTFDWADRNPPGPTPGGLESPSAAFDPVGGVTVLFGGYNAGFPDAYSDKTWEYDFTANTWTEITTTPKPPSRQSAGLSYDSVEQVMVLYGGYNDSGFFTDTWEYDVATNTWASITTTGTPPQMVDTPLAYHASASRHILIGQSFISGVLETWAYNAAANSWTNRNPSGTPSVRSGFAIAYHQTRDRTVFFGGSLLMTLYDQTFEYNYGSNSWTQIGASGPSARAGHSMTYRPAVTSVLLFGGTTMAGPSSQTWRYTNLATWEIVSTATNPPARRSAALAFDTPNDVGVLYGGIDSSGSRLSDTWTLGAAYANAGKYTSVIRDSAAGNTDWQYLFWNKTAQPASTFLRFQLATSNNLGGPFDYVGPGGNPSGYYTVPGTAIWSGHDNQRYIRFLADFGTFFTQVTPSMEDVQVIYDTPPSPPFITVTDPAHIEFNVPLGKWINITFSEAMDTVNTSVVVVATNPPGAFVPPLTWVWSSGDTILTGQHAVPWRENTVYRATVTGKDKDGLDLIQNPVDPNVQNPFIFVTEKQNPFIMKTTPPHAYPPIGTNGYGGPLLDAPIYVDFNEGMEPASLIIDVNPQVPGGFTAVWSNGDRNLTLNHALPFAQCTEYTAQVNATDKVGLDLVPGLVPNPWTFVSFCINPYLVTTSPAHLATDVALNAPIIIDFSEPMNPASVNWTLLRGAAVTFSPTWTNGNRRLTLTHAQPFPFGCAVYEIRINGNDVDGNPLIPGPPMAAPNPWTFVTLCNNPFIIQTVPEDGATDVATDQDILIAFSEEMNTASVNWNILPTVGIVSEVWSASVLLTITTAGFNQCTRYTVTVTAGQNTAGFPLVPGPAPNPWSFDTICDAPYVTATDPANNTALVPVNKVVVVDFSEPMNTGTVTWFFDTVPTGGFVPTFSASWTNGDTRLTLTHGADFTDCTEYMGSVDGFGQDGNALLTGRFAPGAPNPWFFTTRCAGFYITLTDPADGQQNVPLNAPIVVEFSQPADPATFLWTLLPTVTLTPTWSQNNTIVSLTHTTPYPECVTHSMTISGKNQTGADLQNVTGSKPNPWTFKTTCIPPQIVLTNPVNGATGVALAAPIIVTFSEAIVPASVMWTINPVGVTLTPSWSGGNTTLTLTHTTAFAPSTTYTVHITQARDVDGNDLVPGPVPNPWSFTTAIGLAAPPGLHVARMPPNDILLTWQGVTGASTYVVYSSINRFSPWPWPQLTETAATSHFATLHLSDGVPHYYIVRAKDLAGTLSNNSTMGAKIPLSFAYNSLQSNVYWMSIPYRSIYRTAKDITDELTSTRVDLVAKWDPATQRSILWYWFRGAWRGTNFNLNPGDGFYIGVRSNFAWVLNGTDGSVTRTFTLYGPPNANLNWVSLPYTSSYQRASDIVLDIEGSLNGTANTRIIEVVRWDPLTQTLVKFSWTVGGWTGTDFSLVTGEGIYLKVVSTFNWTPRLLTPEVP